MRSLNINTQPDDDDDDLNYTQGDLSDSPAAIFQGLTIGFKDFPTAALLDAERDKALAASVEPIKLREARNERLPISFTSDLPTTYGQREVLHLQVLNDEIHYAYRLELSNSFTTGVINKELIGAEHFANFQAASDASDQESFSLTSFLTPEDNKAIFGRITNQVNERLASYSIDPSDTPKIEKMPSLEQAIQEQIKYKKKYVARTSSNAEEIQTDFKNHGTMSVYNGISSIDIKGISFLPSDIEKDIPQRILDSVAYKVVCANLGELEKNWLGANVTQVFVSITETPLGNIEINIKDNGPGMPKKFISDDEGKPYASYRDTLNALGGGAGVCFLPQAPDASFELEPDKAYFYFEGDKLKYVTLNNRDKPYEMILEIKTEENNSKYKLFIEDMDALKELFRKPEPAGKFSYKDSTFLNETQKGLIEKLLYKTTDNRHTAATDKISAIKSDKDPTKNRGGAGRGNAGASSALEKAGGSLVVVNYDEVINGVQMHGASMTFISPIATQKKMAISAARNAREENDDDIGVVLSLPKRSSSIYISSPTSQFSEDSNDSLSPAWSGPNSNISMSMTPGSMSSDSPSMSVNSPSRASDDMSLASPDSQAAKSQPSLRKSFSESSLGLFSPPSTSRTPFFIKSPDKSDPQPSVPDSDKNKGMKKT